MLYLTTGANGAGKTLFTLKHVHDLALKESRPVYHNGRFEPVADGPLKSWTKIDVKDWQTVPDGAIFLIDECHNDFPIRTGKDGPPEYIRMLAEHRRRGFDFFLITQHPMNIDAFVRRLIGEPGWHSHLKRTPGAAMVSDLRWAAVKEQCEKPGSGNTGEVTMRPFPREVYSWYNSATLHTARPKIPRAVWIFLLCAFVAPVLIWYAFTTFTGSMKAKQDALTGPRAAASSARRPVSRVVAPGAAGAMAAAKSATDYVVSRVPRIDGFPHTAPAYDAMTVPVNAPYPAACIAGKHLRTKADECLCYSQQGTRLQVPAPICAQIVANGFFIEWAQPAQAQGMAIAGGPAGPQAPTVAAAPRLAAAASAPVLAGGLPAVQADPNDPHAERLGATIGAMRRGERVLP